MPFSGLLIIQIILFFPFFCSKKLQAQDQIMTVGLQLKPIIPNNIFKAGMEPIVTEDYLLEVNHKLGYSGGMVIRKGISKNWSIESGINFIRRNYSFNYQVDSAISFFSEKIGIVSYEIPVSALLYIRLSEKWYMNMAFGASMDFYPSDVGFEDNNLTVVAIRKNWIQSGLNANVGYEYRTKKKGYFYVGASLHRPFSKIYTSLFSINTGNPTQERGAILGSYLTLDFRYFFPEENPKRKPG